MWEATFGWWLLAATLKQWAHLGVGGGEHGDQSVPVTWLLAIADDAISLASRCAEVIRDTRLKLTGGRYSGIWAWWDIQVIHQAMGDELGEEECRLLLRESKAGRVANTNVETSDDDRRLQV